MKIPKSQLLTYFTQPYPHCKFKKILLYHLKPWSHVTKTSMRLIDRMHPNRDLSFVVTNELAVWPVVKSFTITFLLMQYPLCAEDAWPP